MGYLGAELLKMGAASVKFTEYSKKELLNAKTYLNGCLNADFEKLGSFLTHKWATNENLVEICDQTDFVLVCDCFYDEKGNFLHLFYFYQNFLIF